MFLQYENCLNYKLEMFKIYSLIFSFIPSEKFCNSIQSWLSQSPSSFVHFFCHSIFIHFLQKTKEATSTYFIPGHCLLYSMYIHAGSNNWLQENNQGHQELNHPNPKWPIFSTIGSSLAHLFLKRLLPTALKLFIFLLTYLTLTSI